MRIRAAQQQDKYLCKLPSRRALTALLSLTLWFCGALTFAEPNFYVRKKLLIRTTQQTSTEAAGKEQAAPQNTNENPDTEITSSTHIEKETEKESLFSAEPVPETTPTGQPENQSEEEMNIPSEPIQVMPKMESPEEQFDKRQVIPGPPPEIPNAQALKPEKKSAQKSPVISKPQKENLLPPHSHPVVQSPIPLLPEKPQPEKLQPEKLQKNTLPVQTEKPAIRLTPQPEKPALKPLKASAKKASPETKSALPPKKSKEKPLVRFPEAMLPSLNPAQKTAGLSPKTKKQNTLFKQYPKAYKALPFPKGNQQVEWHQDAMEAYELGNAMGRENRIQNAISAYQKALQLSPDFADAYVGLSTAYLLQNNWEEALYNAQKGLSLHRGFMDPGNITRANYNLSAAYCVMDHYGKAKQYYDKVKKAQYPLTPQLWAYLQQNCKN